MVRDYIKNIVVHKRYGLIDLLDIIFIDDSHMFVAKVEGFAYTFDKTISSINDLANQVSLADIDRQWDSLIPLLYSTK